MSGLRRLLRKIYFKMSGRIDVAELVSRGLVVGGGLKVMEGVSIDWSHCWHIVIGDDVTLAPGVRLIAHDASTKHPLGYTRIGKIDIGDRVFIGAGSIVLPGVQIGSDVVIGAGSVVSRDVPGGTVACGCPAVVITSTEEFLTRRRLEMDSVARFGEEYTMRMNVSPAMREEMNHKMTGRIGYVR